MVSNSSDGAARGFLYTSVFWLVIGSALFALAAIKLARPEFLATRLLSYGRVRAGASVSLEYGWLGLSSLAATFYLLPRVTGARIRSEIGGIVAAGLVNLAVTLGVVINLFGGMQGHEFSELPPYLFLVLLIALLGVALNVLRTIGSRAEPQMYVSTLHLAGAAVWAPIAIAVGRLPFLSGLPDSIADLFSLNAVLVMWLAMTGFAAVYYVVPRATGQPLYSHRLAIVGFWSLAFIGPLAGHSRQVLGPSPNWLQSLGISAAIGLLLPAFCLLINAFGTLRGGWDRVPSHPSVRFMVGGTLFFAASVSAGVVQGLRSTARALGTTEWGTAQIWLLLLGAFTLWSAGLITYALPRLMGRRWLRTTQVTAHFWLTVIGVAAFCVASMTSALLTATVFNAGVAAQSPMSSGHGFDVVLSSVSRLRSVQLLGALAFALGQSIFAVNVLRTTTAGELRGVEIVEPTQVSA